MIYNELRYAEEMLENGFKTNRPFKELYVLAKYLRIVSGVEGVGLLAEVKKYCSKWMGGQYNEVKMDEVIRGLIKSSLKGELKVVNDIAVSDAEVEFLKALRKEDDRLSRLMFVFLFNCKTTGKEYSNLSDNMLFKLAGVGANNMYRLKLIRKLVELGYIRPTMTGGDQVLISFERSESDRVFKIDDYESPIVMYEIAIAEMKVKKCSVCGKFITVKSRKIRCAECTEDIRKIQWKEAYEARSKEKMKGDVEL